MREGNFGVKNFIIRSTVIFFFFLLGLTTLVNAQDLLKGDLSNIKVDNIPDTEILRLKEQLDANHLSWTEAEQMALQKNMPPAELNKLRDRLARLNAPNSQSSAAAAAPSQSINRQTEKSGYQTVNNSTIDPFIFGSSFFTTASLSFEPNLRIATPGNYTVGPDDELILTVSGFQEATLRLRVQPEGNINIPQVGIVNVNGLRIEEAERRIRDKMSKTAYPNLANGSTRLSVTLGSIRSIRITVIGAAKPGNYTVSSLTTLFNSLYLSGGPGSINTYREIELRRGGKVIRKIDIYQLLTRGDESGNILMQEGDVINFPVYKKHVTIRGEIKRPGTFEILEGETMNDLLFFAGGFTGNAYSASLNIKQVTDKERRIKDLPKKDFTTYVPGNGDEIYVGRVLDKLENSVSIRGAVNRPGQFELTPGLKISDLIKKADGLREDVFLRRALLTRTFDDQHQENIAFQVTDVLNGGPGDILLRKNDEIIIASVNEFKTTLTVTINGEVRKPGVYAYKDNITLKDVLFTAGGLTEAGSAYRIDVSRRINRADSASVSDTLAQVFTIETDRNMMIGGEQFVLDPFDQITVRKKPGYAEQKRVVVEGEVVYPGAYTIQRKGERISELIARVGGLTPYAHAASVFLVRNNENSVDLQNEKVQKALLLKQSLRDTSSKTIDDISRSNVRIPLDIAEILAHPGSPDDYVLEEGDSLKIPRIDPLVKISGEVLFSSKTNFIPGESFEYYLNKAGGTTDNARLNKSYILYANGQVGRTHTALFGLFRKYPVVKTGAEIIVPKKLERKKLSVSETIGITGTLLSLISLVIVTINSLKQ